jgi:predicted small secreted protein
MSKRFILMIVAAPLLLAGCNTTQGVGRDLQSAGEEVEKVAKENK